MADVAVILPVYGRHKQTLRNAAHMVAQAGNVAALYYAVGGTNDESTVDALVQARPWIGVCPPTEHTLTYWHALAYATAQNTDHYYRTLSDDQPAPILCAVANDVWAGDAWLERGLGAYRRAFPDGEGLLGFAGDGHTIAHSCHFLIGRGLLRYLGGWPVWYNHNFGDTELCQRAQELGRYAKAQYAILDHQHPIVSGAPDDAVYAKGRERWDDDQALYLQRSREGWPVYAP